VIYPDEIDGIPRISLLVFGLVSYKFRGSLWTSSRGTDRQLVESLSQAADNWLRLLKVNHPDYLFFCRNRWCWLVESCCMLPPLQRDYPNQSFRGELQIWWGTRWHSGTWAGAPSLAYFSHLWLQHVWKIREKIQKIQKNKRNEKEHREGGQLRVQITE